MASHPEPHPQTPKFSIFRAQAAAAVTDESIVRWTPPGDVSQQGWQDVVAAGYHDGHETKILFCAPGFSLTYVWFKSAVPLPRHAHDTDCLYYILAGSLRLGNETLATGDGFFVGKDVPYTYVPGAAGVEVLEFRASHTFDIKLLAENPEFWKQAVATAAQRKSLWAQEEKPGSSSGNDE